MKNSLVCACLAGALLVSCGKPAPVPSAPTPEPRQAATAARSATAPPALTSTPARGGVIRFALVGEPARVNAWALFSGAPYATRALRAGEVPSLYRLSFSLPERELEPYLAEGMPPAGTPEGEFLAAGAILKEGLTWSDGSPLTARDVAFTVNTALKFHLGLDWASAYDPGMLERAEAVDDLAVKFLFKQPFNVGDWQYGALQGPILNEAYWSPKLAEAVALLPPDKLTADLEKLEAEAATLQGRIDADHALLLTTLPGSLEYEETAGRIKRNQEELNSVNYRLGKLLDKKNAALMEARRLLFALEDEEEPTFGPYLRAVDEGDGWIRRLNPRYPLQKPNFDRAQYFYFPDVSSALDAFRAGKVDAVLSPEGVAAEAGTQSSPTSSMRFLVFNPERSGTASTALRTALACLRRFREMGGEGETGPGAFVTGGPWQNREAIPPCDGMDDDFKLETAVRILEEAGYAWSRRPESALPGMGLLMPGGAPLPGLTLLSPTADYDPLLAGAAASIEMQANYLGIPLAVRWTDPESLRYAVFSSGEYDLAILGWMLGAYPGYLCEWFQPPGAFALEDPRLASACARMNSTADLETSRQAAYEIQAVLMERLPFIPLYQVMKHEAVGKILYPIVSPLDGLSGSHGAPWLAAPSP